MYGLRVNETTVFNLSLVDHICLETDHAVLYWADGREFRITDPDVLREVRHMFPTNWRNPPKYEPIYRSRWGRFLQFLKGT